VEKHHQESINEFLQIYKKDESILAILLAGSIAHGFSEVDSDIDICIIAESQEYQIRKIENKLAFSLKDICTYENGYIDCKVVDLDFLDTVRKCGSDPARYAFQDTEILYSKIDNLQALLNKIIRYPIEESDERRKRFASQLLAWKWYYSEAVKKQNKYLVFLSIQKIVLFSSRLILNENRLLYPYHKWMLKVLEKAEKKPAALLSKIDELLTKSSLEKVSGFCTEILEFVHLNERAVDWPNYFLKDSEQNWVNHAPPIDDL
jgi:predicted nucleotidyltransferase